MVAGGCIVSGAGAAFTVVFKVIVHSFCTVEDTVIFPDVDIARNCKIRRAVIDRGAAGFTEGTRIGYDAEQDAKRFYVSPKGIVLVTPEMLEQDYPHGL